MLWVNFFHIYQPPNWDKRVIKKVAIESYLPFVNILKKNSKIKVTLNITGSLTEQLHQLGFQNIIRDLKVLAQKKQVELTGSALYHPILPLLPKNEIIRQIKLNTQLNRKYFGATYNPKGFFPPEMTYSNKLSKIVKSLGFKWLIIDEIAAYGTLDTLQFDTNYKIKGSNLYIVFRNRRISDNFSFHSNPRHPEKFWEAVETGKRSVNTLITAMDGENLGHHRHGYDRFWRQLVTTKGITTRTISELIRYNKHSIILTPRSSSWSSRATELKKNIPYVLWNDPTNNIHALQWKLLNATIKLVQKSHNHPQYEQARNLLDKRLASDQFWWASAKPWWSLPIIKKKTNELRKIAMVLKTDEIAANRLADKIITTATAWQHQNKFKRLADYYLASDPEDSIRIIGGKKILKK